MGTTSMLHQIKSSDLAGLSLEDRLELLGSLADPSNASNGSGTAYLQGHIEEFEERFRMTSEEMLCALEEGRIEETDQIASWLFYLDAMRIHVG